MSRYDKYRVKPQSKVNLSRLRTDDDDGLSEEEGERELARLSKDFAKLQEKLYAEGKHSLLVVLQAMDAGGKDSTIRHVFAPVNPQGCVVTNFKAPSSEELEHDYLWRVHAHAPRAGYIAVFNRSHYEEVLVVRVKGLVPEKRWKQRYDHINAFEELLHDEGTTVLKFFLHISKDYQKQRLQRRLDNPDNWWKFNPADLLERARWDEYQRAYEAVLSRCSTKHAPWYIVPAEKRWFRNLLITRVIVDTLQSLDMNYPEPNFDPTKIVIA